DRVFSQYLSMVRAGQTRESFEDALRLIPALLDNSRYATHLERYLARFPRDQVHVLFYDQLVAAPRAFASGVFDAIGVPFAEGLPYEERVNPAGQPRSYYLTRLVQAGAALVRQLGFPQVVGIAKRSFLRSLVYRSYTPAERPVLPPAARSEIMDRLEPELNRLEQLLGVDLGPWRRGESLWRNEG
ncbi:MAG TPA: sulfotransferase, partial [Gemmatimonadales bacterium]